jgi:hypothetical protein
LDIIKLDFVLDTVIDVCRSQEALETNVVNSVTALKSSQMASQSTQEALKGSQLAIGRDVESVKMVTKDLEMNMIMLDKNVAKLEGKVDQDSSWQTNLGLATCVIVIASVPDNSVLLDVYKTMWSGCVNFHKNLFKQP